MAVFCGAHSPARAGREVTLLARLVGGGQVVDCELAEGNRTVATATDAEQAAESAREAGARVWVEPPRAAR